MIRSIHIRNYILIEELELEFVPGFSVISGETGAGKSILLGALGLLLGQRAESSVLRDKEQKCVIEGCFDTGGSVDKTVFDEMDIDYCPSETIIRRELSPAGKSRAFINDTPVTLNQLREVTTLLIDIHSQHKNLLIGTQDFRLGVLDSVAGNSELLLEYSKAYAEYTRTTSELDRIRKEAAQSIKERDFMEYQLQELENARLVTGEEKELAEELETLEHAEEILGALNHADLLLSSDENCAIRQLNSVENSLRAAARNWHKAEEYVERINSAIIELKDVARDMSHAQDTISYDPERTAEVSERLNLIYTLERKHGVESTAELIKLRGRMHDKLERFSSFDTDMERLESESKVILARLGSAAEKLTRSRKETSLSMEKSLKTMLVPLGIKNARFEICMEPTAEWTKTGRDHMKFLFSANKSTGLQEISEVASGGEIARVMLSLKALTAQARSLPTILFDEIDTGVSGAVAEQMALLMRDISTQGTQVIAITHLPQIAAMGGAHYRVHKEELPTGTHTFITRLSMDGRVTELAKMMSGTTLTQTAIDNAKNLLKKDGKDGE